ncbi:MAG: hypothetical protein GKR90_05790 [Pseudomonadales bacterium]|nr:hypothetical protein [Pseudomonadales bacterium]
MQVLELNDQELTLYASDAQIIRSEPAAAAVVDDNLVFGDVALEQSRISPQYFNNRYLGNATAQQLPSPIGTAHNLADLVFHHLASYPLADEPLAVLTPSHFANEQLGLLLGICQELKIDVRGFIDLSLAQTLSVGVPKAFQVLDLEWHRLSITRMESSAATVSASGHRVWEGRGLNHFIEGWMGVIADEFMQQTRFDPLHRGDSEQQLFQQAYAWLKGGLKTRISIRGNENDRELDIEPDRLKAKTFQRLEGLDLDTDLPLVLTDRALRVPFLSELVNGMHHNVVSTNTKQSIRTHIAELCEELPADSIGRLSATAIRTESVTTTNIQTTSEAATHLLDEQHHAHLVTGITQEPINIGDKVTVDGTPYRAIKVF